MQRRWGGGILIKQINILKVYDPTLLALRGGNMGGKISEKSIT